MRGHVANIELLVVILNAHMDGRSRQAFSSGTLIAKIGVDTAENETIQFSISYLIFIWICISDPHRLAASARIVYDEILL